MIPKQQAYDTIGELVERFHEQLASYKKSDYNETLVRRDFVDPFFKALGWDVDNSQGYAEAYREVIHEDRVKVSGATKAPDYSFRLPGGKRLFFVEAKKPSVAVKTDILPAYQVRRYAWSAKLPISILTDFEELAVYDCNKKPNPTDKAAVGRIKYLTYDQYLGDFDFIWNTFAKERVLKGGLDKFIAGDSYKKGTTTVDKEFLASLDEWRIQLAYNIALRNPAYTEDELNFTVQQTIDRIIFLRIAEDRGVEEYGRLQKSIATKTKGAGYSNLYDYFKEADEKYNSGLFDFGKDKLSASLVIDDKVLKDIITQLYYPVSPYEFSVLSVEILGSAYEQFLGKQIKLNDKHKAVIEEKPEVRKAGGVYYTPQYIVEYIVENTIGKLTEGKTPAEVAAIKIVDPACGSGSFLIGAYDYLLKWHLNYYKPDFISDSEIAADTSVRTKVREAAIKHRNKLPLTPDGNLTTSLKKQILLNNIYGVDLDTQAVEVTKLSLLLKCMEGETGSSINAEMRFGERVLPTLDNNIKSGNSLIDLDFYETEFDFGEEKKIKPFSWQKTFPAVFSPLRNSDKPLRNPGFDVVIGNPPYGATFTKPELGYLLNKFEIAKKFPDSYCFFIAQAKLLVKKDGKFSYIVPNTFCDLESCSDFRKWLLKESKLLTINQTGWAFKDAIVDTVVFIAENTISDPELPVQIINGNQRYTRKINEFLSNLLNKIDYRNSSEMLTILNKISAMSTFGDYTIIKAGVKLYEKGKGIPSQTAETLNERPYTSLVQKSGMLPLLRGEDIGRYKIQNGREYVKYGICLAAPRTHDLFTSPKILMRRTDDVLRAGLDLHNSICVNSCHVIKLKPEASSILNYNYLLALLNSSFLQKIFELQNPQMVGKVFSEIKVIYVERLPLKLINKANTSDTKIQNTIVKLVGDLLLLNEQKQTTTLSEKIEQLNQRIAYTDEKINKLVYELYGLTEEEVGIVEGKS